MVVDVATGLHDWSPMTEIATSPMASAPRPSRLAQVASGTFTVARHGVAIIITGLVCAAILTAIYLFLVLFAILFGGGLGSFALIIVTPILGFVSGGAYAAFVLCPATLVAERLTKEMGLWRFPAQVPYSYMLALVVTMLCYVVACKLGGTSLGLGDIVWKLVLIAVPTMVPLAGYWALIKAPEIPVEACKLLVRLIGKLTGRGTVTA